MKVLHICGYYATSPLYQELFAAIQGLAIGQIVFVPTRAGIQTTIGAEGGFPVVNAPVLGWRHRLLYGRKIHAVAREIPERLDLRGVDIVHAHTLFSDGGPAYLLQRRFATRYVIAVRGTDVNVFLKWKPYLLPFACRVLAHAAQVVFISPSYRERFLDKLPARVRDTVEARSQVIPNGVHRFWLDHMAPGRKAVPRGKLGLIQVGKLNAGKNVRASVEALAALKRNGIDARLDVVGDGPEMGRLRRLCDRLRVSQDVVFHGHVREKELLRALLQESDIFLFPSRVETFGLVLLEAMSQGLPLIYTRGEGFDGFFRDGHVGYRINCRDPLDIARAVKKILAEYPTISRRCVEEARGFDWTGIAGRYAECYGAGPAQGAAGGGAAR